MKDAWHFSVLPLLEDGDGAHTCTTRMLGRSTVVRDVTTAFVPCEVFLSADAIMYRKYKTRISRTQLRVQRGHTPPPCAQPAGRAAGRTERN